MSKLKRAKKLIGKTISVGYDNENVVINVGIYPPKSDFFMSQEKWFLGVKVRRNTGKEELYKLTSRLNCHIG